MRKGFTLIELVVVIALIAILSVTLGPKVLDSINKAKVSKVLNNLSNLRIQLSTFQIENGRSVDFNNDIGGGFDNVFQKEGQPKIPTYASKNLEENSKIYAERTNEGGWVYFEDTEELYANLPNSFYTGKENEIWNGEIRDSLDDNISDWEENMSEAFKDNSGTVFIGSGGKYYESPWGSGNYIMSINPGVGWLPNAGIKGKLTGNYQIYIDDKLIQNGKKKPINGGQGINIPHSNLPVEINSKEVKVTFEYKDKDGNIKYIYDNLEISNSK